MRKTIFVIAVLLLALMLSGAVRAEVVGRRVECFARELGLDEDQIEQLEALRMEHRVAMIGLRAEQQKLRLTMRMALLDSETDRAGLEEMAEKTADVHGKIEKSRLAHLLAVRKVLNDDQWKQFLKHRHGGRGRRDAGCCHWGMHGRDGVRGHGGRMMRGPACVGKI